jgi:hypothetical protein
MLEPLWPNTFGGALEPQGDLGSKYYKLQKVLRILILGRVYLIPKIQNLEFSEARTFWGLLGSRRGISYKVA